MVLPGGWGRVPRLQHRAGDCPPLPDWASASCGIRVRTAPPLQPAVKRPHARVSVHTNARLLHWRALAPLSQARCLAQAAAGLPVPTASPRLPRSLPPALSKLRLPADQHV